jgi:stage II sporulation protein E
MKVKHNFFDYVKILKAFGAFTLFIIINNLSSPIAPYSLAVLSSLVATSPTPYIYCLLYPFSFFILGENGLFLSALFSAFILTVIKLLYASFKNTIRYECLLFTALSLTCYLLIGNTKTSSLLEDRIICAIITVLLTLVFYSSINAINKKGLKFKFSKEEYLAVSLFITALGLGVSNAISPLVFKGASIFLVLFCCFLYKPSFSVVFSGVLGVSFAIYYRELDYVSLFIILSLITNSFMRLSRFLAIIAVVLFDFVFAILFSYYIDNVLYNVLPTVIGAFMFGVIPKNALTKLKEQLFTFREKQMFRASINQNRIMLSNKLYELSSVFSEMEVAFSAFSSSALTEETAKQKALKELTKTVCDSCANKLRCKKDDKVISDLNKMIEIGFAKGRLSLIDMPSDTFEYCIKPNDIIFALNKMLNSYRVATVQQQNLIVGRNLISAQAKGVSEILKSLALETGQTLKYKTKTERELADFLMKKGFEIFEILIFGEEENITVSLILKDGKIDYAKLVKCVSEATRKVMSLTDKVNLYADKVHLTLKVSADYDAVFGIACDKKDGSNISGDTHSVIRINQDKFMVALSDGMGSGDNAHKISSVSLSLLESFYKAGMKSHTILSTVNKLLSINAEDSFTALDVCVIDLNILSVDFIKYGSPYGFIVNNSGVKIVEGNSLPLGILDELKPCVFNAKLNDGDIVLLITDGISDAFGSSSDVIEYLRKAPYKNPQALADDILKKAVEKNNGKKFDDMTALAVRIFKKAE